MNPFTTAVIKAPQRSRFDFSHSNTVGIRFGALTPTLSHFVLPGDEIQMSLEQIARLAPMPVPTFINLKVRHDFFFVPLRLMYRSEEMDELFGANVGGNNRAHCVSLKALYTLFSGYDFHNGNAVAPIPHYPTPGFPLPGSLFDFLGYPVLTDRNGGLDSALLTKIANNDVVGAMGDIYNAASTSPYFNTWNVMTGTANKYCIEKIIAYHYIWRDWYRFTGIENSSIVEPYLNNHILHPNKNYPTSLGTLGSNTPCTTVFGTNVTQDSSNPMVCANLGQLHYAHLTKDMFTSVRYGSKPTVLIPTGANGTIPALREASAIQRFIDILSITGQRYFDKVKGLFNVESEGPKDDRVQFLARYQQFIKVGEVITTASTSQAETGDYAGRGILIDGKYLFKRRFTEHGYLFCITSVIPDVAYNGLSRELTDVNIFDTPIPSMAQVGDQTVKIQELAFNFGNPQAPSNQTSFGDQFRYYAYKSLPNEVHSFFTMDTARPWSPMLPSSVVVDNGNSTNSIITIGNVITASRVYPASWNFVFNDTSDEFIFGDRFFFNLDFYEKVTRALPKYINYHL